MSSGGAILREPIRRKPRWLARVGNALLNWTDAYCGGGCGYPVTGAFQAKIDEIDGIPVYIVICEAGGECRRNATSDPRDANGDPYYRIRPELVNAVRLMGDEKPDSLKLSFNA